VADAEYFDDTFIPFFDLYRNGFSVGLDALNETSIKFSENQTLIINAAAERVQLIYFICGIIMTILLIVVNSSFVLINEARRKRVWRILGMV
jgi:hypothetical protein